MDALTKRSSSQMYRLNTQLTVEKTIAWKTFFYELCSPVSALSILIEEKMAQFLRNFNLNLKHNN
jgi:hypothetical protein